MIHHILEWLFGKKAQLQAAQLALDEARQVIEAQEKTIEAFRKHLEDALSLHINERFGKNERARPKDDPPTV